jgi:hypothetical protein
MLHEDAGGMPVAPSENREIKPTTAKMICDQLGIPWPESVN